jgi:hypothetical protein
MSVVGGLFLVLFGCSDDMAACDRLPAAPVTFVSMTDCRGQEAAALASRAAQIADYPTVVARCMSGAELAAIRTGHLNLAKPSPTPKS